MPLFFGEDAYIKLDDDIHRLDPSDNHDRFFVILAKESYSSGVVLGLEFHILQLTDRDRATYQRLGIVSLYDDGMRRVKLAMDDREGPTPPCIEYEPETGLCTIEII